MGPSMNGLRNFKTAYREVKKLVNNNTAIELYGELIDGKFYKVFTCKHNNDRIRV